MVVVGIVVLVASGAAAWLTDRDQIEEFLDEAGVWGDIVYVMGFTALQPLSLPGALLIVPATFVWSAPKVFLLSWVGGVIASTVGFGVARWLGREWIEARLPVHLLVWDARISKRGFLATTALRLVTGLAPPADWVLGMSRIGLAPFLLGTMVGLAPGIAALSWFGDDAVRYVERAPLVGLAFVLVAAVLALAVRRRRRRTARPD